MDTRVDAFSGRSGQRGVSPARDGEVRGNPEVVRRFFHAEYWTSFALGRALLPTVVVAVLLTAGAVVLALSERRSTVATLPVKHVIEASSQAKRTRSYSPTAEQWAMLTVEPVATRAFRTELFTEGKISINEELSTPVFPPYAGRVTRLNAKPGDNVKPASRCSSSKRPTWCRRRTISSPRSR